MPDDQGQPEFGNYLKRTRQRLRLSLRKVEELSEGRVKNAFLSQIENGKVQLPNVDLLADLAKVYGLDLWNLMWRAGYRIPRDPNEEEMPDMPWDILWEIATERIGRLYLTQDELDEVLDYADFVKDRGRRHPHLRRP